MPYGVTLIRVGHPQQHTLVDRPSGYLEADGQPLRGKPAANAQSGNGVKAVLILPTLANSNGGIMILTCGPFWPKGKSSYELGMDGETEQGRLQDPVMLVAAVRGWNPILQNSCEIR